MNWKRLLRRALAGAAFVCLGPALAAETETDQRHGADEGPGACWSVESCRRATRVQFDMGADLIAVAGDPLSDISVLGNVQVVIQGGRVVKDAR